MCFFIARTAYYAWPDLHQREHLSVTHLGVWWDGVGAMTSGGMFVIGFSIPLAVYRLAGGLYASPLGF